MNMKLPLALIAGPTASGKSALALGLAERAGGTVINADSAQVYRDLRLVSARPSAAEEARAPHRLYGTRDGADSCSAAEWADDAKAAITEAHDEGRLPILVGGTGLYIRTLIDGIAPVPEIDPQVRAAVRAMPANEAYAALGVEDPKLPGGFARPIRQGSRGRSRWSARPGSRSSLAGAEDRRDRRGCVAAAPAAAAAARRLHTRCDKRFQNIFCEEELEKFVH